MMKLLRRAVRPVSLAGVGVLIALVASWAVAFAQYPPPVGSVTAGASNPAPSTGASVTVACTVVDSQGQPVAGEPCTFTIVSQPGTDASLGAPSVTATTNAQGVATAALSVGAKPGAIVVGVSAMGIQSQVTISSKAPATTVPSATVPAGAQPGAAPPTGAGEAGEGQVSTVVWVVAIAAAVGLALTSLFLWRAAARRPKAS